MNKIELWASRSNIKVYSVGDATKYGIQWGEWYAINLLDLINDKLKSEGLAIIKGTSSQEDFDRIMERKGITMKEYEWTVEASGIIEATSDEEAKEILLNDADGLVADDRKYWSHKIDGVGV